MIYKNHCMRLADPLQNASRTQMPPLQKEQLFMSNPLVGICNQFSQTKCHHKKWTLSISISSLPSDGYILVWHDMRARPRGPSTRSKRASTTIMWKFNTEFKRCIFATITSCARHFATYFSGGICVLPSFLRRKFQWASNNAFGWENVW